MIRIHCYEDKQRFSKFMMIHEYSKGTYVSSSNKMKYCEKTIKLWCRGHKSVEIVNVAKSVDLKVIQLITS